MAKFKKILSFLKGSKKRKSVVIHDSRSIRKSEIPFSGLTGNSNVKYKVNTGRPVIGNGGHYEQFLYVDDGKNGGLKKRTLSVVPSVVSSSNYTQTENEFSDALSHLRSESSRFERYVNSRNGSNIINGKIIPNRMNGKGTSTVNKTSNSGSTIINTTKNKLVNKLFTIRQDPLEEEKVIVEVQDNNEDEIEIDEDELISAIEEFDNERKGSSNLNIHSSSSARTDTGTFIIKEDKEDKEGNQSFIIKNVNDNVHTKKLSFIISSANENYHVDENEEENINSSESYLLSTPNITYSSQEKSNNDNVSIKIVGGMENMKKDYIANNNSSNYNKNSNSKESMNQFKTLEFSSITDEKVCNHHNNDLTKTLFKKVSHSEEKMNEKIDIDVNVEVNENENKNKDENEEAFDNLINIKKVNFVMDNTTTTTTTNNNNNSNKTVTSNDVLLTKKLSIKSTDAVFVHEPTSSLISSPTLEKPGIEFISTKKSNENISRANSLDHELSYKRLDVIDNFPKTKTSSESLSHKHIKRDFFTDMNVNLKQSSSAYTSVVPSTSTRNIFFMPLPRPSQATLLDFGNSVNNSQALKTKKSNLYNHNNHSIGSFSLNMNNPHTLTTTTTHSNKFTIDSSTNVNSRRFPWIENITSSIKLKEGNNYSAPLKASIPISFGGKASKESLTGSLSSNNTKIGVQNNKLRSNPSSNTLFSSASSSLYSVSKNKKERNITDNYVTSTPYMSNKRDTPSFTESSSNHSYISDIPKDINDIGNYRNSKGTPYFISPSINMGDVDINDIGIPENVCDHESDSENLDDYNRIDRSREESLRHVKEYVKSLDDYPTMDTFFSTPLAYRKRYEKYGSMRSRVNNKTNFKISNKTKSNPSSSASLSTVGSSSLKSNNHKKISSRRSSRSNLSDGSSITEYSETTSSYSIHTNSTNKTAPIYSRDHYITKKYSINKPLPLPIFQKFKMNVEDGNGVVVGNLYNNNNNNNKYYDKSSTLKKQGKHKNSSSISSGSTLAYSPLTVQRSELKNKNRNRNLNTLSIEGTNNDYFDDFMKDLNNMSLNDLISKYERK
ncbi:hypothetical protein H8356DRAFT_1048380 [Neocallimastix lanati (nom. inval.)]|uniref:Uncharacterized protein n=1 Tax=Neocallimastix californiae TaxID=1754190 RepID=A0A1Y2C1X0_9FUNG|nr:hypothetical protein H8356DRAFT_1048380 [Neocallimastix sp. JGI-2020a]ORY40894.1 hypothetical protein LY90DRAFT_704075 [Neocallimastix californiae]|eukprot:ORY40894.1 hypothetical protein LY90DRAFT_704075 [Neocallimastix californiae]